VTEVHLVVHLLKYHM